MSWEQDSEFVAWLDQEGLGTDEDPLHEETLDLMHQAWKAHLPLLRSLQQIAVVCERFEADDSASDCMEDVSALVSGYEPPLLDLDLLRKLAKGTGGRRTGALKQAGYLTWEVTAAGRKALGLEPVASRWGVRVWQEIEFCPHWRACLTHDDIIVGQWGGPTQSANNHLLVIYASQQELVRNIAVPLLTMLQNFDRELWRVAPSLDEVKEMVLDASSEMFEALGLAR